ncbi:extracellular solute-binding protein [Patescibacteria group bacterium]|nr:extracellular solute-binding protein [Patescibacteria group bacterium]
MNMSLFQTVVIGVFVAFGLGALLLFATFSSSSSARVGEVLIWGTLSAQEMQPALDVLQGGSDEYTGVTYQPMGESDFIPKLVAAIAAGRGPDVVLFPTSYLLSQGDKLVQIPYSEYSRREFQDTFLEAGEVLLTGSGMYGVPFSLDPLVLYWNRTFFTEAGLAQAPKYWDEVTTQTEALSKSDSRGTLTRSGIAMGTWENVTHAKGLMVSLIRQLGNPVVAKSERGGYVSVLKDAGAGQQPSAPSALRFYTDFADPVKTSYSWNSSQPESLNAFVSGRLALYVGRASELFPIRASNPNLNFDVSVLPSVRGGTQATEATMLSLSIPRGSRNSDGALLVIRALATPEIDRALTQSLRTPSVRRDQAQSASDNSYTSIFRQSALSSFVFLDPDPANSDSVFQRMVERVASGEAEVSQSVIQASSELGALFRLQ